MITNNMNNKENFITVLMDCKGYGEEEAKELAEEYGNDLVAFIRGIGGDDISINECKAFLGLPYSEGNELVAVSHTDKDVNVKLSKMQFN